MTIWDDLDYLITVISKTFSQLYAVYLEFRNKGDEGDTNAKELANKLLDMTNEWFKKLPVYKYPYELYDKEITEDPYYTEIKFFEFKEKFLEFLQVFINYFTEKYPTHHIIQELKETFERVSEMKPTTFDGRQHTKAQLQAYLKFKKLWSIVNELVNALKPYLSLLSEDLKKEYDTLKRKWIEVPPPWGPPFKPATPTNATTLFTELKQEAISFLKKIIDYISSQSK